MDTPLDHFYIVILAGGGGSRLWPVSRSTKPKQFLKLINKKTLLRDTYERLAPLVPPDRIYVTTIKPYREQVAAELPEVFPDYILIEPQAKSTAIAIGMATAVIEKRDPHAIVGTFASDHMIKVPTRFRRTVASAVGACTKGDYILTIGIKPTRPHTGYGYIHVGQEQFTVHGEPIYKVIAFVEKPDLPTATRYLEEGTYLWNASYFLFPAPTMLSAFATFMPHIAQHLPTMAAAFGLPEWEETIKAMYAGLAEEPIEYGILEHAPNILVVRGDFQWSDVGDWAVIYELGHRGPDDNIVIAEGDAKVVPVDTHGCLVVGNGRLIATVGLTDVVIVDTNDALLVCDKTRTQEVRKIVDTLKKQGNTFV